MRKYLFFILILFAVLFLQLLFSGQINPLRVKPDFLLMAVIFLNFYSDFKGSVMVGFLAGFLKDSFATGIFGVNIFAFLVCVVLLDQYKRYIFREDLFLKVILVFLLSLTCGFLNYFIFLSRVPASFLTSLLWVILPETIYTTLLAPGLFWAMRRCALKYSI
jgi:rod shape-determining protein MreD